MRLNEALTYKELCNEFGEETYVGGRNRAIQLKRMRRKATIQKIDRCHFMILREGQDPIITNSNKTRTALIDFCEKRHIKLIEEINENIHGKDEINYICELHPNIIQTSTVTNLLKTVGCPYCKYPMSRTETMIFLSIPNAVHRAKIDGAEFDIFIPDKNIVVEYNGEIYHENDAETGKMRKKESIAKNNNLRFLIIEERLYSEIIIENNKLIIPSYYSGTMETKEKILVAINDFLGGVCNFTEDLWDKAADYMRDWKVSLSKESDLSNMIIYQYDEKGNLVRKFDGFKEIKQQILSGSAFGFK